MNWRAGLDSGVLQRLARSRFRVTAGALPPLSRAQRQQPAHRHGAQVGGGAQTLGLALREAVLASADHAEAAPLGSVAFREIWRRYEDGEITQPVFRVYCAEARKHRGFAHLFGYQRGAPDWTRAPCCVWEAFACGLSPNDLRDIAARGDLRDDVLDDYRQVWRRVAPRFSDTWAEHETTPLRPRAAEALALFLNPVRRAPSDRAAEALAASRRWQALYGPRGV